MKIIFILGTRPEAIKLIPVVKEFSKHNGYTLKICFTGQHQEMVMPIFKFFKIKIDKNLKTMRNNQTLSDVTGRLFTSIGKYLSHEKPDLVFVQGDTNTAMVAATVAFYLKIKIAHVEAGLRTFKIDSPFPEEFNRIVISKIANYHFAPTLQAKQNLLNEGITSDQIFITGNTGIDALLLTLNTLSHSDIFKNVEWVRNGKKIILITCHRRENFGEGVNNICRAIQELAITYKDYNFVFPVHLNPNIQEIVNKQLSNISNVFLTAPQNYYEFVSLMEKSFIILTDSGGIQEEAPTLKKPILVLRKTTERQEAIDCNAALLVGNDIVNIIKFTSELIDNREFYNKMTKSENPFGDGKAAVKIFNKVKELLEI